MGNLLDEYSKAFHMVTPTRTSDGEGGFTTAYAESDEEFYMAEGHNITNSTVNSEREGTASSYIFLPIKGTAIKFHDIFRRVSDGQYFRCTTPTGKKETPSCSGINRGYITAEEWEMTT